MGDEAEEGHAPSRPGSVLLDIGTGVGALVIYTAPGLAGTEIEISPQGADGGRTHVLVRQRQVRPHALYAAVFPALTAGDYTIWDPNGGPGRVATVGSGAVTEVRWRCP